MNILIENAIKVTLNTGGKSFFCPNCYIKNHDGCIGQKTRCQGCSKEIVIVEEKKLHKI